MFTNLFLHPRAHRCDAELSAYMIDLVWVGIGSVAVDCRYNRYIAPNPPLMTKKIQLLVLAFLPVFALAQLNFDVWQSEEVVDEFGDPTGVLAKSIYCEGVFSNSATSNSDLYARVIEQNDIIIIQLFEYQTPPSVALGLRDATGKIKVKREDATVEEYDAFAMKSGGVYFTQDIGRNFIDLVANGEGEKITVLVREDAFSEYGSAVYRFSLITQSVQ